LVDNDIDVVDESGKHRYEARDADGGILGFSAYLLRGDTVVFTHTEVDPDTEGHGVGSTLVRGALDDVRRQGRRVVPQCPFVKEYIDSHQEYADLVD
jgi:predicted GNAT family acetyltransferase